MLDFCIKCVYNKRNRIRRGTPVERGEVYMKKKVVALMMACARIKIPVIEIVKIEKSRLTPESEIVETLKA